MNAKRKSLLTGALLGLPAVYELKVYNANYEQVFFTSFDGILS